MTPNKADATIDEIHQVRREISERFDGDVFAIAADAARRQDASARPVWDPAGAGATDQRQGGGSEVPTPDAAG